MKVINNKGQARLFEHPLLESLSKTRPWVIYAIYIPLSAHFIYLAMANFGFDWKKVTLLFIVAMFSWTLAEYLTHRFLFHFEATSAFGKRIVYIFHEQHHEYPRDKMRLFMPPVPSLLIAMVLIGIFSAISYLATATIGYALVFFAGFVSGYLIYVSMHYAIHTYAPPKYLKALWRNHHLHHYKHPDKAFGVSSVLWDKLFGTLPPSKESAS